MTASEHDALNTVVMRMGRVQAILVVLTANDDSRYGEALRGVADMLDTVTDELDGIVSPRGAA